MRTTGPPIFGILLLETISEEGKQERASFNADYMTFIKLNAF